MPQLKAVLFDLDGTLIDSEYFHYQCWMEILATFSISIPYSEWVKTYAGHTLPRNCQRIKETFQLEIPLSELVSWRERLSIEAFSTRDIDLMQYALETLQFFKDKGLKIGLVTAAPRYNVNLIFERNGLTPFFDVMVTRTDLLESKPNPECYIMACAQLGIDSTEAIAFEDTPTGLQAAKGANVSCYAIQRDPSQHAGLALADQLFPDLRQAREYIEQKILL
jgi:HAD superfamily hydrolase (TIGR01509 family)